ncbi:cyclodeaminase/cyclohydrolase family protein [Sphingomonas sp. MMS24-J13]|uniref:cyclodeaminase/cyclohydrolase family protein n=1 Tax=Sphingomonas sp. MMS24-J13 TaxID=3238686 RepID=UPI00384B2650
MERVGPAAIGDFLAAIASTGPAPGAGSTAAVSLALGIACARKAMAITLQHHPDTPRLGEIEAHFGGLGETALAGADADMKCFTAYIDACRLSHDDPDRPAAERAALEDLVAVGQNVIAQGDEASRMIDEIRASIIPMMANDIAAALSLIAAARTIHVSCTNESRRALDALPQ